MTWTEAEEYVAHPSMKPLEPNATYGARDYGEPPGTFTVSSTKFLKLTRLKSGKHWRVSNGSRPLAWDAHVVARGCVVADCFKNGALLRGLRPPTR